MNKKYTIEQHFCQLLMDNNSNLYFLLERAKEEFGLPNKEIFFNYLNTSSVIFLIENYHINKEEFYKVERFLNKNTIYNYLRAFTFDENELMLRLINNKPILDNITFSFDCLITHQLALCKKTINHHIFYHIFQNSIHQISAEQMQQFSFKFLNKFYKIFEHCADKFQEPKFNEFYKQFLSKKTKIYSDDLFHCKFNQADRLLLRKTLNNLSFLSNVEQLLEKTNILTVLNKLELFDFTYSQYLDVFTDEELHLYKTKIQQLIIKNSYKKHYKVYSTLIFISTNYLDRYYLIIDKKFYSKYINHVKNKEFTQFFEKNENLSSEDILKQQHLIKLYLDHFFSNLDFYLKETKLVSFDIFEELSNYNKIYFSSKIEYSKYIDSFFNLALPKILNHNIFLSFLFCDFSSFFLQNEFYNFKLNKDSYSVNYLIFLLKNYWLLIQKFEIDDEKQSTKNMESILFEFINDINNKKDNVHYQSILNYSYIYLSSKQHSTFLYYLGNIFQEKYYKFLHKLKEVIQKQHTLAPIKLTHETDNLLSLSFNFSGLDFIAFKIHLIPEYFHYYLNDKNYNSYFLKYLLKKSYNKKYKKIFLDYFNLHHEKIIGTDIWLDIIHSAYFKNTDLKINGINELIAAKKLKHLFGLYLNHINNYNQLFIDFKSNPKKYPKITISFFNELKNFIMQRNVYNFNNNSHEKTFNKYSNINSTINNILKLSPQKKYSYLSNLKNVFFHIDYLVQKEIHKISYEDLKKIIKKDLQILDFSFISFFVIFDLFHLFEEYIINTINKFSYQQINDLLDNSYFLFFLHNINLFKSKYPIFQFNEKNIIILHKLLEKLSPYHLIETDSNYIVYILNMFNNKNAIQKYIIESHFSHFILENASLHFNRNSSKIFTQPYSKDEILYLFENNLNNNNFYDIYKVSNFLSNNFEHIKDKTEFIALIIFYAKNHSIVTLFLIKIYLKRFSINLFKDINSLETIQSLINLEDIYIIYENFYNNVFPNMHFHGISYFYQLSINFFKEFNDIQINENIINKFLILFFKKDILLLSLFTKFFHIENALLYINQKFDYLMKEQSTDYLILFYNNQNIKINQSFAFFQKQFLEFLVYLLSNTLSNIQNRDFFHWLYNQLIIYYKKQRYFTNNVEAEDGNEFKYKFLTVLLNNPIIIDTMEKTKFALSLNQNLNQPILNTNNRKKIKKI